MLAIIMRRGRTWPWIRMRPFLARFSEPVWSGHLASWADFITATSEFRFSAPRDADFFEQLRQCAGKRRDQGCGHHSRQRAAADPAEAMRHGACNCQHNADDQAGFKHFAKDNYECSEHLNGVLLHLQRTPRLLVEVVVELVAARLQRPHIDH